MKKITIDELFEHFTLFDDWEEKYRYIIELGELLEPMPNAFKIEENRVSGCISNVWMVIKKEAEVVDSFQFSGDSDSSIVRGLIYILQIVYSGKTKKDIQATDVDSIFRKLGLDEHITQNRRNGFFSMVERIRALAEVRA